MPTESFILIDQVQEADIETVLSNLANLYAETGYTEGLMLYENNQKEGQFFITFTLRPDFEHFAYFVNYIHYPEGFKIWESLVTGFYQVKPDDNPRYFKSGEWLQFYVSKTDTGFDNVSVINAANESFLYDFGGNILKLPLPEIAYALTDIRDSDFTLLKVINPV